MPPTHNTKWTNAHQDFQLGSLPAYMADKARVVPATAEFDPSVGREVFLNIFDTSISKADLEVLGNVNFDLAAGMVGTQGGPVAYLLLTIPAPAGGSEPWATYTIAINPHAKEDVALFRKLADQSHWHLRVIGAGLETLGVVEVENTFDVHAILDRFVEVARDYPCHDFDAAKTEFEATFTVDELRKVAEEWE